MVIVRDGRWLSAEQVRVVIDTPPICANSCCISSDATLDYWIGRRSVGVSIQIDGSGRVHLVDSMPVLGPDEQVDFHCLRCDVDAGHHRGPVRARCTLRGDLHELLGGTPSDPAHRTRRRVVQLRSTRVPHRLEQLAQGSRATTRTRQRDDRGGPRGPRCCSWQAIRAFARATSTPCAPPPA